MAITLTPKGWASVTPGALSRTCGHPCAICEPAALTPEYRELVETLFDIAELERQVDTYPSWHVSHRYAAEQLPILRSRRDELVAQPWS